MAKTESKEVAVTGAAALPAHLAGGKKASLGNIDRSDIIIPRVKLLQGLSPELETFNEAKAGLFWHTMADQGLGEALRFIPLVIKKSYVLWAPRGDERGILARADDAINWDTKDKFEVKPKGAKKSVIWDTTEGTVAGSGLDQFGTSNPDDDDSGPAAALTYSMLFFFPDYRDLSPAVVINTRSAIKKAKQLISKIEMRPVDHYGQMFTMSVTKETVEGDSFYNYAYTAAGYANEADYKTCQELYQRFSETAFRANDEAEEAAGGGDASAANSKAAGKF